MLLGVYFFNKLESVILCLVIREVEKAQKYFIFLKYKLIAHKRYATKPQV